MFSLERFTIAAELLMHVVHGFNLARFLGSDEPLALSVLVRYQLRVLLVQSTLRNFFLLKIWGLVARGGGSLGRTSLFLDANIVPDAANHTCGCQHEDAEEREGRAGNEEVKTVAGSW